ncbi:hypothetical protein SK128_021999 [Halocaridina rubra]|uniref:Uncharacterized protein n=1 Tax=Halocaridina rubra TaxID=373956 RepID=A0AAN8XJG4_HALRR
MASGDLLSRQDNELRLHFAVNQASENADDKNINKSMTKAVIPILSFGKTYFLLILAARHVLLSSLEERKQANSRPL